eukprot:10600531-Prorocentrum_lima.AAC.1
MCIRDRRGIARRVRVVQHRREGKRIKIMPPERWVNAWGTITIRPKHRKAVPLAEDVVSCPFDEQV